MVKILLIVIALLSCIISMFLLLHGLLIDGPEFYNGKGCRMTYSQYIFLPLRIIKGNNDVDVSSSSSSTTTNSASLHRNTNKADDESRYRLLKFTDARDPRHQHLYPIVGNMKEDYASQQQQQPHQQPWGRNRLNRDKSNAGRMLELTDNWCLLPSNSYKSTNNNDNNSTSTSSTTTSSTTTPTTPTTTTTKSKYTEAPYPHAGHIVLYIPGHWGSYLQSRSLGAHGTRYTGQQQQQQYQQRMTNQEIYTSLQTGLGMNNGLLLRKKQQLLDSINESSSSSSQEEEYDEEYYQQQQQQQLQNEFVMDVYSLDYIGQGGALHSSILFKQAKFFASAIQTLALGCHLDTTNTDEQEGRRSVTIVAHSIGAIIVRLALRLYPQLLLVSSNTNTSSGYIHNIITLASPLGLDFPYAVDADIHDVIKFINDHEDIDEEYLDNSDVSLVSISGGLRDEMIPPTACQIPSSTAKRNVDKTNVDNTKRSQTFLASDIMHGSGAGAGGSSSSTINSDPYGMDHRAIVWCFDLLTVVREIIFTLVNATDNGSPSSERLVAVTNMMDERRRQRQGRDGLNNINESRWDESNYDHQKQVEKQYARLLLEMGYLQTVSIQLSAPYYLNTLLKLCITAALLDTYAIYPSLKYFRQSSSTNAAKRLFRIDGFVHLSISLLSIPTLLVVVTWMRQVSIPYHHQFCHGHECYLLLLSIFILTQIATLVYIIIVYGVCPLVSIIFMSRVVELVGTSVDILSTRHTFWISFVHWIATEIRTLIVVTLPLSVILCYMINSFILGFDDLAWNTTAIASYCFVSVVLHNLISLIILATRLSVYLEQRRSEIFFLFLSLIKFSFGKSVLALSLMTLWGQRDLNSYHDYLTMTGKGNVMITRVLTVMLSSFIIIAVYRTYDAMTWTLYRRQQPAQMIDGRENTTNKSTKFILKVSSTIAIVLVRSALICWFTWTASVNIAADDVIIPIGLLSMTIFTSRCHSCTDHVIDVCSSSNSRSVRSDSTQTHDKVQ